MCEIVVSCINFCLYVLYFERSFYFMSKKTVGNILNVIIALSFIFIVLFWILRSIEATKSVTDGYTIQKTIAQTAGTVTIVMLIRAIWIESESVNKKICFVAAAIFAAAAIVIAVFEASMESSNGSLIAGIISLVVAVGASVGYGFMAKKE